MYDVNVYDNELFGTGEPGQAVSIYPIKNFGDGDLTVTWEPSIASFLLPGVEYDDDRYYEDQWFYSDSLPDWLAPHVAEALDNVKED